MKKNYGNQFHERHEEKPHIHPMQQTNVQNDNTKSPVDRIYKKGIIIGILSATICFLLIFEMILIFSRKEDDKSSSSTKQSQNTVNKKKANSNKKFIIAIDNNYPPFEFTDNDGSFVRIDVDLLEAIAEDQGFEYELNPLNYDEALNAPESGQADGVIAVTITEERKLTFDFSEPYYDIFLCIAVKADSTIMGFEDLKGKKVGANEDSYAGEIAAKYEFDTIYCGSNELDIIYQDVLDGKLAACLQQQPFMAYEISKGTKLKIVDVYRDDNYYSLALAVLKGQNQELLDLFNAGLKNIKTNGKYDAIVEKYIQSK